MQWPRTRGCGSVKAALVLSDNLQVQFVLLISDLAKSSFKRNKLKSSFTNFDTSNKHERINLNLRTSNRVFRDLDYEIVGNNVLEVQSKDKLMMNLRSVEGHSLSKILTLIAPAYNSRNEGLRLLSSHCTRFPLTKEYLEPRKLLISTRTSWAGKSKLSKVLRNKWRAAHGI